MQTFFFIAQIEPAPPKENDLLNRTRREVRMLGDILQGRSCYDRAALRER